MSPDGRNSVAVGFGPPPTQPFPAWNGQAGVVMNPAAPYYNSPYSFGGMPYGMGQPYNAPYSFGGIPYGMSPPYNPSYPTGGMPYWMAQPTVPDFYPAPYQSIFANGGFSMEEMMANPYAGTADFNATLNQNINGSTDAPPATNPLDVEVRAFIEDKMNDMRDRLIGPDGEIILKNADSVFAELMAAPYWNQPNKDLRDHFAEQVQLFREDLEIACMDAFQNYNGEYKKLDECSGDDPYTNYDKLAEFLRHKQVRGNDKDADEGYRWRDNDRAALMFLLALDPTDPDGSGRRFASAFREIIPWVKDAQATDSWVQEIATMTGPMLQLLIALKEGGRQPLAEGQPESSWVGTGIYDAMIETYEENYARYVNGDHPTFAYQFEHNPLYELIQPASNLTVNVYNTSTSWTGQATTPTSTHIAGYITEDEEAA